MSAGGERSGVVIYQGRGMRLLRAFTRVKVLQLTGIAGLAIPIATVAQGGTLTNPMILGMGTLSGAACLAMGTLYYFGQRYIGELAILHESEQARFSVIDFWGNRQDRLVHLSDIDPPFHQASQAKVKQLTHKLFRSMQVVEPPARSYLLSLRHGHISDKDEMMRLLRGDYAPASPEIEWGDASEVLDGFTKHRQEDRDGPGKGDTAA